MKRSRGGERSEPELTTATGSHQTEMAIRQEVYKAFQSFGAKSDILSLIGSWGDTLEDEDILSGLQHWNKTQTEQTVL